MSEMSSERLREMFPHASEAFILSNSCKGPVFRPVPPVRVPAPAEFKKTPQRPKKCPSTHDAKNDVRSELPGAKLESPVRPALAGTAEGKEKDAGRVRIVITSVRRRLIDPDNLVPKYFVDCCRYAGLIAGDSADQVEVTTTQRKPVKGEEEHTIIDLIPIP